MGVTGVVSTTWEIIGAIITITTIVWKVYHSFHFKAGIANLRTVHELLEHHRTDLRNRTRRAARYISLTARDWIITTNNRLRESTALLNRAENVAWWDMYHHFTLGRESARLASDMERQRAEYANLNDASIFVASGASSNSLPHLPPRRTQLSPSSTVRVGPSGGRTSRNTQLPPFSGAQLPPSSTVVVGSSQGRTSRNPQSSGPQPPQSSTAGDGSSQGQTSISPSRPPWK